MSLSSSSAPPDVAIDLADMHTSHEEFDDAVAAEIEASGALSGALIEAPPPVIQADDSFAVVLADSISSALVAAQRAQRRPATQYERLEDGNYNRLLAKAIGILRWQPFRGEGEPLLDEVAAARFDKAELSARRAAAGLDDSDDAIYLDDVDDNDSIFDGDESSSSEGSDRDDVGDDNDKVDRSDDEDGDIVDALRRKNVAVPDVEQPAHADPTRWSGINEWYFRNRKVSKNVFAWEPQNDPVPPVNTCKEHWDVKLEDEESASPGFVERLVRSMEFSDVLREQSDIARREVIKRVSQTVPDRHTNVPRVRDTDRVVERNSQFVSHVETPEDLLRGLIGGRRVPPENVTSQALPTRSFYGSAAAASASAVASETTGANDVTSDRAPATVTYTNGRGVQFTGAGRGQPRRGNPFTGRSSRRFRGGGWSN